VWKHGLAAKHLMQIEYLLLLRQPLIGEKISAVERPNRLFLQEITEQKSSDNSK
jgi:hypothetical protein